MRTFGVACGLTAFGLTAFVASAMAAELPAKAPPPPAPAFFNWSGFYIGGHVGGGWASGSIFEENVDQRRILFDDFRETLKSSGVVGGGQIGFNWQFWSNWVIGVEGDFSGTSITEDRFPNLFLNGVPLRAFLHVERDIDWLATARGRLGYAWDRWLLYATGGGAWTRTRLEVDIRDSLTSSVIMADSFRETRSGWVAGGGFEYAFAGYTASENRWGLGCCWTARIEFLHYQFEGFVRESQPFQVPVVLRPGGGVFTIRDRARDFDVDVVRFGINYKFGPAPAVAARY